MNSNEKPIKSVEDYIQGYPPEIQQRLYAMRAAVKNEVPQAEERISYGMPAYFFKGPLVYFAAFKNHIGLYPAGSSIEILAPEIEKFKHSKGAIQFPLSQPLPLDLIARIIKYRLAENILLEEQKENTK